MKVAVLGTGFGAYHAELYTKISTVDKVVVWGRNEEKLKELESKFQVEITKDMESIWNDPEIRLVDVCLPNQLHKEMAIKALQSGKHVFIETPVAETVEEAKAIKEVAEAYHKRVFVDLFIRFEYAYDYLYQLVKNGQYGDLKVLQVKRETPHWWGNLDMKQTGLNLMMHDVDFMTRFMGVADSISVTGIDVKEEQSAVTALFKYKDSYAEVRGVSAMAGSCPFSVGYEAVLEEGIVRYYEDGYDDHTDARLELFHKGGREEVAVEKVNCYEIAIKHVLECIEENKASFIDINDAIMSVKNVVQMNKELENA